MPSCLCTVVDKMISNIVRSIWLLSSCSAQDFVRPKCNFAMPEYIDFPHPFPIGACLPAREVNGTHARIASYRFACNDQGTVDLEAHDDLDCANLATRTNDTTTDLIAFECGMDLCDYALAYKTEGCGATCANCVANPIRFDMYTKVYIINQCYGHESAYKYNTCSNNIIYQTRYGATACNDPDAIGLETVHVHGGLSP